MAIALGTRATTTTQTVFLPKAVDTILGGNGLAPRLLRESKIFRGLQIKQPIIYQKGVAGGSFSGLDTFSTAASNTRVNLVYDPAFYEINVTIPFDELWTNQAAGAEQVLDLMAIEIESKAQQAADELGTLFYGDGTGNSSKDFLGLEAIVDDNTNVITIGGLSRNTYTTLKSTVTASGGTLTLAKMATLFSAITSGTVAPTDIYTTETIVDLYEQLLQAQERIMKTVTEMKNGLTLGTGATTLAYKGRPMFADEKCTSGVMYALNMNYLKFHAMPLKFGSEPIKYKPQIEGNDYESNVMGLGFHWSGWTKISNAAGVVGHIYLGGELISTNFKRHGKLTSITSV